MLKFQFLSRKKKWSRYTHLPKRVERKRKSESEKQVLYSGGVRDFTAWNVEAGKLVCDKYADVKTVVRLLAFLGKSSREKSRYKRKRVNREFFLFSKRWVFFSLFLSLLRQNRTGMSIFLERKLRERWANAYTSVPIAYRFTNSSLYLLEEIAVECLYTSWGFGLLVK